MEAIADSSDELFIELAAFVHPELDVARPEAWNLAPDAIPVYPSGQGVVIGVVDTGIDIAHDSFRDASRRTRLDTVWAQNDWSGHPPAGYEYGTEFTRADIDLALVDPNVYVPPDVAGHGTGVAGVAASNGRGSPAMRYKGVATESTIIVVALDAPRHAFPSTANVVEAVSYIFEQAERGGRRAVVNLSQGTWIGPHDRTGQFEEQVDSVLGENPGRILVTSAGNTGAADAHARFHLNHTDELTVPITVPPLTGAWVEIDIWYLRSSRVSLKVTDPTGASSPFVRASELRSGRLNRDEWEISAVPNIPGTGANEAVVTLRYSGGDVSQGEWQLTLRAEQVSGAEGVSIDAWIDRSPTGNTPTFASHATRECTVTAPGTAKNVIVAGSYDIGSLHPHSLSTFSAYGPDRLGRPINLIAAPGEPVTTCTPLAQVADGHAPQRGTSFAAALITGAIGLMLHATPTMSRSEVIERLVETARVGAELPGVSIGWGCGKLDIAAAIGHR